MSHAIYIKGKLGERHPHTWEIAMSILRINDNFTTFTDLEKQIDHFFSQYQEKYLNDCEPFDKINPTLENACEHFKNEISKILNNAGWILMIIEISETPTRSYVINVMDDDSAELEQSSASIAATILDNIKKTNNKDFNINEYE